MKHRFKMSHYNAIPAPVLSTAKISQSGRIENSFTFARQPAMLRAFMTDTNLALWGMIVVPLGLAICFGPALLIWLRDELRASAAEKQKQDGKR
jgi:hypothetical protein